MKSAEMDRLFLALASEPRRDMLDIIRARPGCSVAHVAGHFDVSRIAVMKHLNVLESANLVISDKVGRTRELYFNAAPIQQIHERWTDEFSSYWAGQLTEVKRRAESNNKNKEGKR